MELTTERALISPISENDFDEIITLYKEPESNKYIPPLLNKSEEFYRDFLKFKVKTNKSTLGFWTVREKVTNEIIGTVNLNNFKNTDITHIGCHLAKSFWNKGFAVELLTEIRNYGFNVRGLDAIHGIVSPEHVVSVKMLKRLGLTYYRDFDIDGEITHLYRLEKS